MKIQDKIYGEIVINDTLIAEIINSEAFQRLKNINQYGGVNFVYPNKLQTSRYEHSIGVWYVLNSLNTPREIQINGLLHDLGHVAFSHMVDQAKEVAGEDYHEQFVHQIKGYDQIIELLEKNNIKLQNVDSIPEIKLSLPDIGADRLDYGIRDFHAATQEGEGFGRKALQNIKLVDRKIVFTNIDVAREYANKGNQAMWEVIYDPKVAVVYQSLIDILKDGFEKEWLKEEDLLKTDKEVLDIMRSNRNKDIDSKLDIFERSFEVIQTDSNQPYDLKHVKMKVRYFDPLTNANGKISRLSDIDPEFKIYLNQMVEKFKKRVSGEYFKIVWK